MNYKQKYLKYKEKYLQIKKLDGLIGGSLASESSEKIPIIDITSGERKSIEQFTSECIRDNKPINIIKDREKKTCYKIILKYESILYNGIYSDNDIYLYDNFLNIDDPNFSDIKLSKSSFIQISFYEQIGEFNISTEEDFKKINSFNKLDTIFILLTYIARFLNLMKFEINDVAKVLCVKRIISTEGKKISADGNIIIDKDWYYTLYYRIFADQKPLEELSIYNKFFTKKKNFSSFADTLFPRCDSYKEIRFKITREEINEDDLILLQKDLNYLRSLKYNGILATDFFKDFLKRDCNQLVKDFNDFCSSLFYDLINKSFYSFIHNFTVLVDDFIFPTVK